MRTGCHDHHQSPLLRNLGDAPALLSGTTGTSTVRAWCDVHMGDVGPGRQEAQDKVRDEGRFSENRARECGWLEQPGWDRFVMPC